MVSEIVCVLYKAWPSYNVRNLHDAFHPAKTFSPLLRLLSQLLAQCHANPTHPCPDQGTKPATLTRYCLGKGLEMTDVDMKDAAAAAAGGDKKDAAPVPASIKLEDIVRNVELIVKAVESKTARLTTRAISRYGMCIVRAYAVSGFGFVTTSIACTFRSPLRKDKCLRACWLGASCRSPSAPSSFPCSSVAIKRLGS